MPVTGEDQLDILLNQNVETEGLKAASGLERMRAAFDGAASAGAKLKMPDMFSKTGVMKGFTKEAERAEKALVKLRAAAAAAKGGGGVGFDEAVNRANKLPSSLSQAPPVISGFEKVVKGVEKLFGPTGAEQFTKGATALVSAGDEIEKTLGPIGPALGSAMATGATTAAAVLAAAAIGIGVALVKGAEFMVSKGIEETSARKGAMASIGRLGGDSGEKGYKVAVGLAGDLGMDKGDAIDKVKALLEAKVSKKQIPLAVHAIADLGVDLGEEKANSFAKKLGELNLKGAVSEESIKGFAESGVSVNAVYAELVHKGETLAQTMARVKSGAVSAADATKAIVAAVEKTSGGGAAGKAAEIEGSMNRIKIGFSGLFDSIDTSPLKSGLGNAAAVLSGEGGASLKTAVTGLGDQVFKTLFGPFEGEEGKAKLEKFVNTVTKGIDKATEVFKMLEPIVSKAVDIFLDLGDSSTVLGKTFDIAVTTAKVFAVAVGAVATVVAVGAAMIIAPFVAMGAAVYGAISFAAKGLSIIWAFVDDLVDVGKNLISSLVDVITGNGGTVGEAFSDAFSGVEDSFINLIVSFYDSGAAIIDGFVDGITSGAGKVINAIKGVLGMGIDAGHEKLQQHSPSKVFADMGMYSAMGFAQGANDNAGVVADAGAGIGRAAVGGAEAVGGSSGGGAAQGRGGGMNISHTVHITLPPGSTAETKAAAEAGVRAGFAEFETFMLRYQRDRGEATAAG